MQLHSLLMALSSSVAILACVDQLAISSSGDIRIRVTTERTETDPHGFRITIDGGYSQSVDPNDPITLVGIPPGPHQLLLGLPSGCVVAGQNPRTVEVGGGGVARADFVVTCGSPAASG